MSALRGVRVVDFGTMVAGPFGGVFLADLGADVIKVEPLDGDPWRRSGAMFLGANRGKRSLAVDLRSKEGLTIVQKLIAVSDIFMENARLGVTKRLGLDYDSLVKIKPDLIYVSALGHGSSGPYAHRPAVDTVMAARGGMMAGQGGEGNPPVVYKTIVNDVAGPMLWAYGAMLALYQRQRTGIGQHVETSLTNAAVTMQSGEFVDYKGLTNRYRSDPERKGASALDRLYQTADKWIFVFCRDQKQWQALCQAIGRRDLSGDSRFSGENRRRENDAALVDLLTKVFLSDTAASWLRRLKDAGVQCAPQPTIEEVLQDPHFLQNQVLVDDDHPEFGRVRLPGIIPRFSETPGRIQRPAPTLGQHTDEILTDLGYSFEEIGSLRERRLIV